MYDVFTVRYDLIYYIFLQFIWPNSTVGHAMVQLVKALRYKPEGRGFYSRWCHWNFSFI
jgi:hypothetical protein